ncbi:hypothetical protein GQ600_25300 [Phytophthora cactorum]|nr:hypothetical protein GQ600_25300 [Phytophthora cactorum]
MNWYMHVRWTYHRRSSEIIRDEDLHTVLYSKVARRHLVIIDGDISISGEHQQVNAGRGLSFDYLRSDTVERFTVSYWTLEEYQAAVKNDEFFDSVAEKLDTSERLINGKVLGAVTCLAAMMTRGNVEAKYYYADGSSRYMCFSDKESVVQRIKRSVDTVPASTEGLQATFRSLKL